MPKTYTVQPGDTLERIAIRECGNRNYTHQIILDNNITNPSRVAVGQVLILTCGEEEETQPGAAINLDETLLSVPYYSQEDPTAQFATADCGPACLRMMIGWHHLRQGKPDPQDLTVDDVTKKVGIRGGQISVPRQLVRAAPTFGLRLLETQRANLKKIVEELDAGRPLISMIHYGSISGRMNQRVQATHFVVVVGYNSTQVILNDPDWWGPRRREGAGFRVPRDEFETAIGNASQRAGNVPYWGVLIDPASL